MSVYKSPYYILCDPTELPKSDDENSISNLGGEYVDYYCIYLANSSFTNEFYMNYEHYLEQYMSNYYKDPRIVKYVFTEPKYERDGATYSCTKYSFETPYNILKIHIEYDEANRDTLFVCSSICAKLRHDVGGVEDNVDFAPDSELRSKQESNYNTKKEKTNLVEYLEKIREKNISINTELNDEYFEELQEECAIEYARDHC